MGARLLGTKLVAGESKDKDLALFMQSTQTCVLGGEASLGSEIDDQQCLLAKFRERNGFPGN